MSIESKIISSLEKCFPTQKVSDFSQLCSISALANERVSFQVIFRMEGDIVPHRGWAKVSFEGDLAKFASMRTVECIPSLMPCYPSIHDDNYLSTEKGLYPDLLLPVGNFGRVPIVKNELRAYWVTLDLDGSVCKDTSLSVIFTDDTNNVLANNSINIKVIDAILPKQDMKVTQWFHGDCLADYYNCEVFSRKWWKIVENFVKTAVRNGINLLLTPVFTPPLDTAIGHERKTVQLVDVTVENGKYTFGYKKLDKWIKMCDRCGIEYFEISHLFTQWGAAHAPKVMATVDGEYKRIFGWDTVADGPEYSAFLRQFVSELIAHLKAIDCDKRCLFHISDEPNETVLDQYKRSKAVIADLLDGYTVMDALSNVTYYEQGLVSTPIPANNHIEPFIEKNISELWTYYCCGQSTNNVSNRFFAMPSWRTRSIGSQFFKYDIAGFLQWGYNFYYSQGSLSFVNPYLDSTGNYFTPSGDTYSVYPGQNGQAYESLRIAVFYDALQDLRAFKLCASLIGKDKTLKLIESELGDVRFNSCARSASPVLAAREKINSAIEQACIQGGKNA